jgi:hypothetical protein
MLSAKYGRAKMGSELEKWAVTERQYLNDEKGWLEAGGRLLSPSGDDITAKKLAELAARLEHADKVINEFSRTDPT